MQKPYLKRFLILLPLACFINSCISTGRSGKLKNLANISKNSCDIWLKGEASFYANSFEGRKTASGETFSQTKYTAAHLKHSFGTLILVRNEKTKRYTIVQINDRGPYVIAATQKTEHNSTLRKAHPTKRVLDLSEIAAQRIGLTGKQGIGTIRYCVLPKHFAQEFP